MIWRIKKLFTNAIFCRWNTSTTLIVIVAFFFIIGNFILLKTFYNRQEDESVATVWTFPKKKTAVIKKLTDEELFVNKFKDYEMAGKQEINELPNNDSKSGKNEIKSKKDVVVERLKVTQAKKDVKESQVKVELSKTSVNMAVLVISCNRPSVGRCLDRIFKYKPQDIKLPIIVSQDCGHEATANVIKSYGDKVTHIKQPDLGDVENVPGNMRRWMGYYKISRHFKFALGEVFANWKVDSVVIVEDDIDIAPDFFDYFLAARPLLEQDKSIYCVSAWNDNGKSNAIDESAIDLLYRSDFFPGLGWLITRDLWEEIGPKWPLGFWDDWMRAPEQRKGRVCIRPEISRTKTFGRIGVSQGQFFDQYLKYIKLNTQPFPFSEYDLTYLTQEKYDEHFLETVYASPEKQADDVLKLSNDKSEEPIRITYSTNREIEMLTKKFGLMNDLKAGVARTAYKGIVSFYRNNKRIYLAPSREWKGYKERD